MHNFEEYERKHSRPPRRIGSTVTVLRAGSVSFSADAMAALGSPGAILYLVDRGDRLLGFRAAKRGTKNSVAIGGSGNTASARAVLRHVEADLSQSRRYPLVKMGGVQCIDLKQPGEVVTSNRPRKE